MVFIFSTPLNFGLDSSWGHMRVLIIMHTGVGNNTSSAKCWYIFLLLYSITFQCGCFIKEYYEVIYYYDCYYSHCQIISLPHQSLLWSRWGGGGTPVLPYWHQTRYKTLWSLGWRRTSHTPTRMTDDKGPDNKRDEDNSWMLYWLSTGKEK